MDPRRRDELEKIMAAMADGDRAMVFRLVKVFGGELAAFVRWVARTDNVSVNETEVGDLVMDCALRLADMAGSWRPDGGALPWVWARRALIPLIRSQLFGPVPIDPVKTAEMSEVDRPPPKPWEINEPDWMARLEVLAETRPEVAHFLEAVSGVKRRNVMVYIQYRLQQFHGDPEPSRTVGDMFGLTGANVRQISHRVEVRLRAHGVERVA